MSWLKRLHAVLLHGRMLEPALLLLLRLYLAPVMIAAGWTKATSFQSTVQWFGNPDWGLGMPFPELMAFLAAAAELGGGVLLLAGLATRYAALPLMVTMLVAAFSVHWQNSWFAVAPSDPATSAAAPLATLGIPAAERSLENSQAVGARLEKAREILREHGHYDWLTETGSFVVLNNGIEFAATYFLMLLALFIYGAGRYVSVDYWLAKRYG